MSEFIGRIGHISDIESPFSNAGGVAKTFGDVELLSKTGIGAVEVGSITPEERSYLGPTYFDASTSTMYNAVEMNNMGLDKFLKVQAAMVEVAEAHGKPLIVNV